jgi:hypothetical protein
MVKKRLNGYNEADLLLVGRTGCKGAKMFLSFSCVYLETKVTRG